MYLITGAAWASGRISDSVVELLRSKGEPVRVTVPQNDGRANRFRELGAEVAADAQRFQRSAHHRVLAQASRAHVVHGHPGDGG